MPLGSSRPHLLRGQAREGAVAERPPPAFSIQVYAQLLQAEISYGFILCNKFHDQDTSVTF